MFAVDIPRVEQVVPRQQLLLGQGGPDRRRQVYVGTHRRAGLHVGDHCYSRAGLLAYYDVMISSGPMEGTNNKIKTMKRQAYGFRDMEFFKLKILSLHEAKYTLVG